VSTCNETAVSPAAQTKLCNTEVYCGISCARNTPRRTEQDECYDLGNCFWLCVVSVRYLLLYLDTSLLVVLRSNEHVISFSLFSVHVFRIYCCLE